MFNINSTKKLLITSFFIIILSTFVTIPSYAIELNISVENILNTADKLKLIITIRYNKSIESINYKRSDIQIDNPVDIKNYVSPSDSIIKGKEPVSRNFNIITEEDVIYNSSTNRQYQTDEIIYTFQVFEIIDLYINPMKVVYSFGDRATEIYTPPIPILSKQVDIIRNEKGQVALRGLKAPFGENTGIPLIAIIFFVLAFFVLVLVVVLIILRRKNKEELSIPLTPLGEALEKLAKLKSSNMLEKGNIKDYYIQLSAIIRQFLASKLHMHIMESPTDKVKDMLNKNLFNKEQVTRIIDFLEECDRVKFAKHIPNDDSISKETKNAYDILNSFRERESELINT